MSSATRNSLSAVFAGFRDPLILALGTTSTISYGTMYYAYGVLAPSIAKDFGVGLDWFFGVFTVGLLVGGFVAPKVGKALDHHGAGLVMTWGSVAAALALFCCALAPTLWTFVVSVIFMEAASCLVMYEAAFAALAQAHRHQARRSITSITLIAGFASTIFWPLTQFLLVGIGWRNTFAIYAVAHLIICLPIHRFIVPRGGPETKADAAAADAPPEPPTLTGADRKRALILYTFAICLCGFVFSSFPVHMIRIIENEGFAAESAALIAMLMGPAQVLARIVEIGFGHRFDALMTGRVSLGAAVLCIAILLIGEGSLVMAGLFAALYGVSQGLITIARGTVPLQLFGPDGYATLVGKITGLRLAVNAAGPYVFALIATQGSVNLAIAINGLVAVLALAAFWLLRAPQR